MPVTTSPELFERAVALGMEVIWLHTYGAAFIDSESGRSAGDVRLLAGDSRRVMNIAATAEMPSEMTFDETTSEVRLGGGAFGPVSPAVWEYTVGGKNVLRSWFSYRKAEPGGKKSSPLDDVHVSSWSSEWTSELLDLLSVLTRLVGLEEAQAGLLDEIMTVSLASRDMLASAGAVWPGGNKDPQRKPDYLSAQPGFDEGDEGQLGFSFT